MHLSERCFNWRDGKLVVQDINDEPAEKLMKDYELNVKPG